MQHLLKDREREEQGNLFTRLGQSLFEFSVIGFSHIVPFISSAVREMPSFKGVPSIRLAIKEFDAPARIQESSSSISKSMTNDSLEILNRTRNSLASWSTAYKAPIKMQKSNANVTKPQASLRTAANTIESRLFSREKLEQHHLDEVRGLDDIFPSQVSGFFSDVAEPAHTRHAEKQNRKELVAAGKQTMEFDKNIGSKPSKSGKGSDAKPDKDEKADKNNFVEVPPIRFSANVLKKVPDSFPKNYTPQNPVPENDTGKSASPKCVINKHSIKLALEEFLGKKADPALQSAQAGLDVVQAQQDIQSTVIEPSMQEKKALPIASKSLANKRQPVLDPALADDLDTMDLLLKNNRKLAQSISSLTESYFAQAAQEQDNQHYI